ncbi:MULTISPECIES: hypothetical protein [unclassified Pseudoalteromonas]|uniref:hypothetical protein n=1 Tax=Pseudoalteromonas TaxID=53246 RepID=UPI001574B1C3|nr:MULTISPECIES: hypothetical protein [unclassified Pseudoalteromonas]MBR8841696.1 hypothetical protein [Pseudoalteromonas sp. JC3]MCG7552411.1 hypothetical protein [Pseudoalteromonas sp. Of11M-6]NSY34497.1 hypothetical protein [Pseudoalteromonas sp. JC28]WJE07720.1 hypothetical protein QSH61_12550 [Pseudoalteromonas sp. JC3]
MFKALGELLILWNIAIIKEGQSSWHFPSFEIQEYLLPIINVGGQNFDEYGQTNYTVEDCRRLINTVAFAKETLALMSKSVVRYETIEKGLVSLNKCEIMSTLAQLSEAAELAIKHKTGLLFYGD